MEEINQEPPEPKETFYYIFPAGLMPGAIVSSETIRKVAEAEQRREEKKDKNNKPPKPPSRPNARIGGVALGNA